jgi:hypothetical protein
MAHNEAEKYRAAAQRCRTRSSQDLPEWTRFSQEWEKLAGYAEALSAERLKRAKNAADASIAAGRPGSCENPRKSLLLAGVFCSRGGPSFHCEPLSCETSVSQQARATSIKIANDKALGAL